MFISLKGILEGYEASQEKGFFHFITETPYVSATHIVAYHLINALSNGKNVIFLALQNSWSHYCEISNKFGINLRSEQNQNSVKVLNGLRLLAELVDDEEAENLFSFIRNDVDDRSLKKFSIQVLDMISELKKQKQPVVMIIDSLTPLLNMGIKDFEIKCFIQLCSGTLSETEDKLVAVCTESDSFSDSLVYHLRQEASVSLSVRGLSTGISQDVFGELSIHTNPENFLHSGVRLISNHRYKIEQRDVKLFPVG